MPTSSKRSSLKSWINISSAAVMSSAHLLIIVVCAALVANAYAGTLEGCDDCSSSKIPLTLMKIYFHDETYGAYEVDSNGYVCLFSNANSSQSCYSNQYTPQPITEADGPAFLAPFWNDIDLRCRENGLNFVQFYEKVMDIATLQRIQRETGDLFNPDFYVSVSYKNVKEFPCKEESEGTNTFEVLIATENNKRDTRVIMDYGPIDWIKYVPPTIGFGDGDCRGQVGFRPPPTSGDDISYQTKLFRVTDPLYGDRCIHIMEKNDKLVYSQGEEMKKLK